MKGQEATVPLEVGPGNHGTEKADNPASKGLIATKGTNLNA